MKIFKNFDSSELGRWDVNSTSLELLTALQKFRNWYHPHRINITSFARSKTHNKAVGGSENSLHLESGAIDFTALPEIMTKQQVKNMALKWREVANMKGLAGLFPNFEAKELVERGTFEFADTHFHVDLRQWGDNRFHLLLDLSNKSDEKEFTSFAIENGIISQKV